MLAQTAWIDATRVARSATYLAEADDDLRALETWLMQSRALPAGEGEARIDIAGLPREVRRRLARTMIERVRARHGIIAPMFTSATNIEPLLDALAQGKGATQAGIGVAAAGDVWCFRVAPPRRNG